MPLRFSKNALRFIATTAVALTLCGLLLANAYLSRLRGLPSSFMSEHYSEDMLRN